MLMAAAQYSFYLANQGVTVNDVDHQLAFKKCYIFGPSTANVRIERFWLQGLQECLGSWRDLFTLMEKTGVYVKDWDADRLVILFVFMPIIRLELGDLLADKNSYRIRPQDRPYHVHGVPNDLYEEAVNQHAFPVNDHLLRDWEGVVASFGEL
jgi:hypothetical protein